MSLAAAHCQLDSFRDCMGFERTSRNHRLDEVSDVAQNDTETLHRVCIASLGLHSLDLHALQHRALDEAAVWLKYAPAGC